MFNQITVPFYGTNLFIVNLNNEPYTPMKPIIEGMGMVWGAQAIKIKQRFTSTVSEIDIVAGDGKIRKMICLPLRKLAGWLQTISPNKVNPKIRDKVIQYQNECDDVLYEYWTTGEVKKKTKTTVDERTPLRDAVNMLVGKKGLLYPDAYAFVHQKFNITHIDELEPEQITQAVEYIHKLVLEGEYLPKPNYDHKVINTDNLVRQLNCLESMHDNYYRLLDIYNDNLSDFLQKNCAHLHYNIIVMLNKMQLNIELSLNHIRSELPRELIHNKQLAF